MDSAILHTQSPSLPPRSKRNRDHRVPTFVAIVLAIAGLGLFFSLDDTATDVAKNETMVKAHGSVGFASLSAGSADASGKYAEAPALEPELDPKKHDRVTVRQRLQEADHLIRQRQFDEGILALNRAQPLLKEYPETYLLIGRALEGKKDYNGARDFYQAAINRNPYMADAYWGMATASEGAGDLLMALGAMRSYLHTEPDKDPNRLRIAQARSAIWEWESQLGRGPWGPTKGVPPGFTAAEIKRDGRGVGIKVGVPGTQQPDGTMQAEMKHQDKFKIYPRN